MKGTQTVYVAAEIVQGFLFELRMAHCAPRSRLKRQRSMQRLGDMTRRRRWHGQRNRELVACYWQCLGRTAWY